MDPRSSRRDTQLQLKEKWYYVPFFFRKFFCLKREKIILNGTLSMNHFYNFLTEMDNVGQNMPQSFNNAANTRALEPVQHIHDISLAAAVKPLSIGSSSYIIACPQFVLKKKIDFHLQRLSNLQKKIQMQANDPKKANQKAKYTQELQFAQQAYQVHHEYFTKILYWKQRSALFNMDVINKLNSQYQRKLFLLNQNMQRIKIGLQTANTANY